jgi:hypothetical protein
MSFFARRQWHDLPENPVFNQSKEIICHSESGADAPSFEPYLSTEIILECSELEDTIPLFTIIRITTLNLIHYGISARRFIDSINQLPNLDTLSINSIPLKDSSFEDINTPASHANKNKYKSEPLPST